MHEMTIHIYPTDQGGYKYDIYRGSPEDAEGADSIDGGHCTTTMVNALGMAASQAEALMPIEETEKCDECGNEKLKDDTCANCD